MPDPIPPLTVFVIQATAVESLALYDRDNNECGVAELITAPGDGESVVERWRLECRAGGQTFTNAAPSFEQAYAWLVEKRNGFFEGGCIRAFADFRVDESDGSTVV